jgi:hypothetical protein
MLSQLLNTKLGVTFSRQGEIGDEKTIIIIASVHYRAINMLDLNAVTESLCC